MCNTESIFLCVSTSQAQPLLLHITTLTTGGHVPCNVEPEPKHISFTSLLSHCPIGNESVPIQSAQCWFTGLAISNAKIQCVFQIKYMEAILSNSTRKLLWFENTKKLTAVEKKINLLRYLLQFSAHFRSLRSEPENAFMGPLNLPKQPRHSTIHLALDFFSQWNRRKARAVD